MRNIGLNHVIVNERIKKIINSDYERLRSLQAITLNKNCVKEFHYYFLNNFTKTKECFCCQCVEVLFLEFVFTRVE